MAARRTRRIIAWHRMASRGIGAMANFDGLVISTTWSRALKGTPTEGTPRVGIQRAASNEGHVHGGHVYGGTFAEGVSTEVRALKFPVGGSFTTRDQTDPGHSERRAGSTVVWDRSARPTRRRNSSDELPDELLVSPASGDVVLELLDRELLVVDDRFHDIPDRDDPQELRRLPSPRGGGSAFRS